jgi:hypothetical protein
VLLLFPVKSLLSCPSILLGVGVSLGDRSLIAESLIGAIPDF